MAERFRKKPVIVEAVQYNGPSWLPEKNGCAPYDAEEWAELRHFTNGRLDAAHVGTETHGGPNQYAPAIRTLEGRMVIRRGDWLIKGVKGEFYPCKPDIFAETYEAIDGGGINYDGLEPSVECAYPPCTNRLRRVGPPSMSGAPHPQWCSKYHRELTT